MRTRPDVAALDELPGAVARVRRRLAAAQLLEACSVGLMVGAGAAALARAGGWSPLAAALTVAVVAGILTGTWFILRRSQRTVSAAADRIEHGRPECRNVVVTAVELTEHPARARPWIRQRVLADANRMLAGLEPRTVVPLHRRAAACVLAVAVTGAVVFNVHERTAKVVVSTVSPIQQATRGTASDGQLRIVVTLLPPAHTKLPSVTLSQPDRLSAVEGTRVRMSIRGSATPRQVRFGSLALTMRPDNDYGATIAEHTLRESGYLAVETEAGPRLIPVAVIPDRVPTIKIERPGRDLLVPNASPAVPVETSATDDFGLEELALRYTKVSGSGEQFEFVEGEVRLAIARQDSRAWRGRAEFALSRLGLEPGDSLVYRVVARDARPGDAGLASSDTFFIEVAGPGQVALEGFEMPPDRERHGLSQQMIVLKIQRLRERERNLGRDGLQEQTAAIAAEQRAVRANFVFLTGGHVEDEEEEAEHSHEIQEGRLENTARREISRAIGHMSLAEQGLVTVDTTTALAQAKLAVGALQRAFGRNRYILRTLPVRSRVDPSRRLTGKLDEARGWTRKLPNPSPDARAQAIRDLLAEMISMRENLTTTGRSSSASAVGALMERALAIDPANSDWQQISMRLGALRDAIASGAPRETVNRRFADALSPVVVQAQRASMPRGIDPGSSGPLRGAWAEEMPKRSEGAPPRALK